MKGESCEYCGMKYEDFRTGLDFKAVRDSITEETHPNGFRRKTRRTILGYWHGIKQKNWQDHLDYCEQQYESYMHERAECTKAYRGP